MGYCPNCGRQVTELSDGGFECQPCSIAWHGPHAAVSLKPEPYAPGELEETHRRLSER